MHASATLLPLHILPSSLTPSTDPKPVALGITKIGDSFIRQQRIDSKGNNKVLPACRASRHDEFSATEFNLYELLGIDSCSDTRQIKEAYRALQKRCHPDIAGPPGHDMAIVLNEAYALLSDPNARMAYDRELAKVGDLLGYTGRPIYSRWCGSESEEKAIFVDEVKCVGCLKCALFAGKTFAVESVYGRARVVAQWADPQHKINQAIAACPVDCISYVERSELAALEFVMSKQPRGNVRIGASNTGGVRTADVFDEVEKFQARYKASKRHSNSKDTESESSSRRISAIQMISNWLYWQPPTADAAPLVVIQNSKLGSSPTLEKLKAAARVRATTKNKKETASSPNNTDDYWVPGTLALPTPGSSDPGPTRKKKRPSDGQPLKNPKKDSSIPFGWVLPAGASAAAAAVVADRLRLGGPETGLQDHIAGSLALAIVNSPWMQVGLAAVTWYLIGVYILEILVALRPK
ncbi:chaperone protein dnaJ C76, chloroplastic-like [Salvia splendens]|uniref:chaperone protein dnaJ C76, chloroplastic-like n=1 Tax=Salvia splendens TaxID=180675 RepID=UPI001C253A6B|nr:chaperone protein dnaJ C76, chloroplastic-like [Salvia splendens]